MTVKELITYLLDEDMNSLVMVRVDGTFWQGVEIDGVSPKKLDGRIILEPDKGLILKP